MTSWTIVAKNWLTTSIESLPRRRQQGLRLAISLVGSHFDFEQAGETPGAATPDRRK
jgi:hypothetical protein